MTPAEKLSPRQRECLRLHWQRRATSKEIAQELGIAPSTVDGYFAEAIEVLGAANRRDAAARAFGPPPESSGGEPSRVAPPPASQRWLPLRTGAHNDLGILARIVWIFALAVGAAIGFGSLASGVRILSDLFR